MLLKGLRLIYLMSVLFDIWQASQSKHQRVYLSMLNFIQVDNKCVNKTVIKEQVFLSALTISLNIQWLAITFRLSN